MGGGEESTPTKQSKPASSVQEAPTTAPYPDWSSSMQAYYGGAAPAFYASTVASAAPHPYMWGGQHPLMPPYGTPIPYPALYPPGGIYAHPSMSTNPSLAPTIGESERKVPDVKERTPTKNFKAASGNTSAVVGKAAESEKAASSSGNDPSLSAESGVDGSSDASEEDTTNPESAASKKRSFHQMLADGASAQNNTAMIPVVSMPATNLNIGMDFWNASPSRTGSTKVRPNPLDAVNPGAMCVPDGMPDQWDERELKRQKRKQSNRESARRSRLRKQAECEELQGRVEALNNENRALRDELERLSEECEKITSENQSIKEELIQICGPEVLSKIDDLSQDDEGLSTEDGL